MNQLKQIHNQLVVNGFNYQGKLIEGYSAVLDKNGVNHARLVFKHTSNPHLYVWNVMIRCLPPKEAIRVFADGSKLSELVFDEFAYVYVLGACARWVSKEALFVGKQIHGKMFKVGFVSDVEMQTTGIYFYASHGDCRSARKVFDEMLERSSATWNAMISGYCSQKKRVDYFSHEALMLFCQLLRDSSDVKPTGTTMVCVLSACSRVGDLMTGSCVHGYIEKTMSMPLEDIYIGTCLVEMYSKCGCLNSALSAFNWMKVKNILTWTSMLTGLAIHGRGKEALEKLDAMQATNIKPNEITFTSLLFACCHAGLVEEGICLFHSMSSKFGLTPRIQHYGCIVDLLGRAGQLQEAYDFVNKMPIPPDAILWRSLLGACNIHGDVGMGEKVGRHLLVLQRERDKNESEPKCEDFIALSNVYASAERWEELEIVRKMMRGKGIQIIPGSSSVQLI
ncbi:hypothetical protein ACHQM5_027392 [Ranunculus cassubicifolius]